jgi:hypothetical protein
MQPKGAFSSRCSAADDSLILADLGGCRGLQTRRPGDLAALAPRGLPTPFHSGDLAAALTVERFVAQRIAYCLLHCGAAQQVGKRGNARMYELNV